MEALKDFYTVQELAKVLNLVPESIRAAIRKGQIKALKLNGAYIISRDEADRVIRERNG